MKKKDPILREYEEALASVYGGGVAAVKRKTRYSRQRGYAGAWSLLWCATERMKTMAALEEDEEKETATEHSAGRNSY